MSTSPPPASFQKHCDELYNSTYRDTIPAWAYVNKAHGDLASAFRKQPKNANCSPKLKAALTTALAGMAAAKRRGTFKPAENNNKQPLPKRAHSTPAPTVRNTRHIQITEQTPVGFDEQFWIPTDDGHMKPAPLVDFNDLNGDSNGLCLIDPANAGRFLNSICKDSPFGQASALLCRESLYYNLISKNNRWLAERFPYQRCDAYFTYKNGPPVLEKCLLIQLSH